MRKKIVNWFIPIDKRKCMHSLHWAWTAAKNIRQFLSQTHDDVMTLTSATYPTPLSWDRYSRCRIFLRCFSHHQRLSEDPRPDLLRVSQSDVFMTRKDPWSSWICFARRLRRAWCWFTRRWWTSLSTCDEPIHLGTRLVYIEKSKSLRLFLFSFLLFVNNLNLLCMECKIEIYKSKYTNRNKYKKEKGESELGRVTQFFPHETGLFSGGLDTSWDTSRDIKDKMNILK